MSDDEQPRRGRGRPRRGESDADILASARNLLAQHRYGDLTLEQIGRDAGVAKTTIYRRWPSKAALIADLIRPEIQLPEGGPRETLGALSRLLRSPLGEALGALIGEAQTIDETRAVVRELLAPFREQLERSIGRDAAMMLLGAVLLPRLIDRSEPDDAAIDRALERLGSR